jgi:hypothetical protein
MRPEGGARRELDKGLMHEFDEEPPNLVPFQGTPFLNT